MVRRRRVETHYSENGIGFTQRLTSRQGFDIQSVVSQETRTSQISTGIKAKKRQLMDDSQLLSSFIGLYLICYIGDIQAINAGSSSHVHINLQYNRGIG